MLIEQGFGFVCIKDLSLELSLDFRVYDINFLMESLILAQDERLRRA